MRGEQARGDGSAPGAAARTAFRLSGVILFGFLVGAGPARAECTGLPRIQTQPRIDAFLVRPEGLLERFPRGDVLLAGIIAQLVASDYRATLKPVVKLIDRSNGLQRVAIGQALAAAVAQCRGKDPTMIETVATAIATRHDQEFLNGYYMADNARLQQQQQQQSAAPAPVGAEQRPGTTPFGDPFKLAPLYNPFAPPK